MSRVEVLLATMNQSDLTAVVQAMNVQTDMIIANQADRYDVEVSDLPSGCVKMITTPDRGVGRNRNIALAYSSAEFLLFADDGIIYLDGYENTIVDAFDALPNADMIMFSLQDEDGNNEDGARAVHKTRRVRLWNFGRYATPRFAVRRSSWQRARTFFTELYAGGAIYSTGDDNIFLRDAMRVGLKVYASPAIIATDTHTQSTWFRGYTEKYMFDGGATYAALFPKLRGIAWLYHLLRMYGKTGLGLLRCMQLSSAGAMAQRTTTSYEDWLRHKNERGGVS